MPSFVWNHFDKIAGNKARCNERGCIKELSYLRGMSGLVYHLKKDHNITDLDKSDKRPAEEPPIEPSKRQTSMLDYCKKPTIQEEVSRVICESNLSFNTVVRTPFVRRSLQTFYPDKTVPQDNKGISAMMMKYFEIAEANTKIRILELKKKGKKFSATLDEWTSSANCRYLNINIHFTISDNGETSFINLGLLKIKGRCKAERMVKMVRIEFTSKLSELYFYFGLLVRCAPCWFWNRNIVGCCCCDWRWS